MTISDIKNRLLNSPDDIKAILEHYKFCNIIIKSDEIRCGVSENSNSTSVRIKLKDNENLIVNDFGRGLVFDLFNYIINIRETSFKEVINYVKAQLNIEGVLDYSVKKTIFGGVYEHISTKKNKLFSVKIYDDAILDKYEKGYSLMFYNEGISFETQEYFNIRYDVVSQRIVFPIYNIFGEIIGIKGRADWKVKKEEAKYLYLVECKTITTLYGYFQNYQYMFNNVVCVAEAEKSVMQAHSMGYRNIVAIGTDVLSIEQCVLIMELCPQKVILLLDEGLEQSVIDRNIKNLKKYSSMRDTEFGYWDWSLSLYALPKCSPTDLGKDILNDILENEIIYVKNGDEDGEM